MRKLITCFLIFMLGVLNTQAQEKMVRGTIYDETGGPLPGASIIIKGKTTGVSSDFDGNFSIQANDNNTLVISYIGYITQEVTVNGKTVINVTLKPDVNSLEEVVVVAYGTQKKEAITSSVTSIKEEELKDVTTSNVSSMLQGKAAGVQVTGAGGSPGSTPTILIRGMSSLNGNVTPLWVVDGVIQHGTPIVNPNDVETMSLLKDASATSLYGSRGANGVIIITTKRAKEGVSKLTFTSKVGLNEFNPGDFEVMNSQQLYDYHALMGTAQDWYTEDLLTRDYDWIDGATQTALVQDYNVSYSSGNEKMRTYLAGGYYSEEGTVKGSEFDRYTFRLNLDYKVNDRLTLKPKMSFSFDDRYSAQHGLYGSYTNLPWDLPVDAEGNTVLAQESQEWIGRDQSNYFYDLQTNYGTGKTFNMSFNGDFEFKILDDLTFVSTNNFTLYNYKGFSYTDPNSISGEAESGALYNRTDRRLTRLTTQMLRYTKEIEDHSFTVLTGYEYNDYVYENYEATKTGLIGGGTIFDVASNAKDISGKKYEYALQSGFLNVDYSYGNRYFAKGSIRRDGASNFGVDNQYGTFFALGAGWSINNEDFFNSDVIDVLKLRASYGSVGNRPNSLYPHQATYSASTHYDAIPAATLSQYGNSDLAWEKSYEANIAVDTRILDRISATFEYYNKNTSDLLYYVDLPAISGFNGYWENVGGLKNTGFEVVLGADVFKNTDFKWNVDFNIGVNKNEITELFDGQTEIPRGNKIFKIGEDMNTWYMRKWAGVHPGDGKPLWEVVDSETGEISYTSDYNAASNQLVSNATPDFIGGFSSNMEYKGFSLSTNFSFVSGGEIYNSSRSLYDSDGLYPTFNQQVLADGWSRWENPGDVATHPQAIYGGNNNSNKSSSRYLEDGSFVKLRNVTLAYNIPENLLKSVGVTSAKVYFSGDNLLTFTNYSGMDPEAGRNLGNGTRGLDGGSSLAYPAPERFVFGLNLSF